MTSASSPTSTDSALTVMSGAPFAVGDGRVIAASASGVPETVICVKLMRVTLTPFTGSVA